MPDSDVRSRPGRVLVLGATGYVGSRLVPALLESGHEVTVGVRDRDKLARFPWGDDVTVVDVDVMDPTGIGPAVESVDVIYYLIHSMDGNDFIEKDHQAAKNVIAAAEDQRVGRIVYLSGLVPDLPDAELSDHLYSRLDIEKLFSSSPVASSTVRAAIVLGAGSASFEMLRQLSERVPFSPLPGWLNRDVQPISVADILGILVDAGAPGVTLPMSLDVGGPEVMKYAELIEMYCRVAGLRRIFIPLPFIPHRLVAALACHFVDLSPSLVQALIESLGHDMVCRADRPTRRGSVAIADAMRLSLEPPTSSADPHVLQSYDAPWAGGDVEIVGGLPTVTGGATGGVGLRSRKTSVPVLMAAVPLALGLSVVRIARARTAPRHRPVLDD